MVEGPMTGKFQKSYNRMNYHDIHSWVLRDGEIVDDLFGELDGKQLVYSPLNDKFQNVFMKLIINPFLEYNYDRYVPADGFCNLNSIYEIKKSGGQIIFGSLGYMYKSKVVYVWGHPKFKKYQDFITARGT